jgi:hypothetical protein
MKKIKIEAWAIVETKSENPFPIPGVHIKRVPGMMASSIFELRKDALIVQIESRNFNGKNSKMKTKVVPCTVTYEI